MPNIDQVQLPDGSQYNLRDNISGYVTAQYVNDVIDGLTKANVGLGNVDNTSDLNKPVSTAQQTALNGKTDTTVIAPTEATTTASRRYEIGEQFILNGVLYTATAVIASGDTIIVDTNCELSESITKQLKDIDLSADNVTFDNTGTGLVSENVEDAIKEVNTKTSGLTRVTVGWTNPSPTASFAAQTVTLSDNDYDALEVDAAYISGGSQSVYISSKLKKNGKTELQQISASGTNLQYFYRSFTDDGNGHVQITDGLRIMQGTTTQYDAANALVPQEIRLIKYI